jgi:UDP-glucose 4-epimerase
MNKFLVTGGCGFIGSHLVEFLASKGDKIYIIDDLSSGYISNIEHIKGDIIFFHSSVQNFDFSVLENLDAVFHLAAQASVPYSIENFVESSTKNMMSTFKIIDFCSRNELPFIYASSSALYGNLPFGDETNEVQLLSPYAADKYSMEIYAKANYNLKKHSSFGLRFFNVYGPRQDPSSPYSGVISIFIDRLLKNLPISINGGYQTRDFVFVTDVVNCLYRSYEFLTSSKGFYISNVLTGKSISISEMLNTIEDNLKVKAEIIYKDLPMGDPEVSLGSTSNMESLLAIELESLISVNTGISLTISHMK